MVFYKIIDEDRLVGIATSDNLMKHQKKHNILVFATLNDAQFVACGDKFYHADWMKPIDFEFDYIEAYVTSIDEEEYNELSDAIAKNEKIEIVKDVADEVHVIAEAPLPHVEELTVEFVRETKLKELSLACNKAITDGFDLELNGKSHHFSMTMQDQINLMTISTRILQGETEFAYHADGEEIETFSASDMTKIISASNAHKEYNIAYYNALKKWINSLRRITSIGAVEYGDAVPPKYQSTFFKNLQ